MNGNRPVAPSIVFGSDSLLSRDLAEVDWAATPLGPPEAWPQSLRRRPHRADLALLDVDGVGPGADLLLQRRLPPRHARQEISLGARPAGARGLGGDLARHRPADRRACSSTGTATWDEALLLFLERSGYVEETYHTFSYSPLADEHGAIAGHALRRHARTPSGSSASGGWRRCATSAPSPPRPRSEPEFLDTVGPASGRATRGRCRSPSSTCSTRTARDGPAGERQRDRRRSPGGARADRSHGGPRRPGRLAELAGEPATIVVDLDGAVSRPADRRVGTSRRVRRSSCRSRQPGRIGRRLPGRRRQPLPAARRGLSRFRRPDRRPARRRESRAPARTRPSVGAPSARRARPGQDHVLHQHQPRVPDAADADARPGRGRAGRRRGAARRAPTRPDRDHRTATPAAAEAGQHAARLLAARVGSPAASYEPVDLAAVTPPSWPACSARAVERAGLTLDDRLRSRCPSRCTSTARCGRRSC